MERAKVIKKINNLKKIKAIIEIAKFDTLQKLANTNKIKDHHYEMATISQDVLTYARSQYRLSSSISRRLKMNVKTRKLFIFLTIPSFLIKVSYSKFEKMILREFDTQTDEIIVVGDQAIKFAKNNELKIKGAYEKLDDSSSQVISLINSSIDKKEFEEIKLVANTPKMQEAPFQLFPVKLNKKKNNEYKKYTFYHSLSEMMSNIIDTYIENTITSIYLETTRVFYQKKLVKHEGSIKNIDEKAATLKRNLNKINRQNETEEMIQISHFVRKKG